MNKDDPNAKDSKGKIEEDTEKLLKDDPEGNNKEDTKEKLKGDLKGKIEEDTKKMLKDEPKEGSSFVKRKPPKELLKGGLRDRSLFSWLRILGWILTFTQILFLDRHFHFHSLLSGHRSLVGFHYRLPDLLLRPHVGLLLLLGPRHLPLPLPKMLCNFRYSILYGSEEDSRTPYFVRNQHKYPDILPQPGVNIECVSTSVNYQNFQTPCPF